MVFFANVNSLNNLAQSRCIGKLACKLPAISFRMVQGFFKFLPQVQVISMSARVLAMSSSSCHELKGLFQLLAGWQGI